jgi:cobalt-zinc-cadmium efflux system outer membrane protein
MRYPGWSCAIVIITLAGAHRAHAAGLRLTIEEAVSRAVAANLELGASSKDVDLAKANVQRSKAWFPSNPYFATGAQHSQVTRPNYTFFLSQEFEIAGQRGRRMAAAAQSLERATWDFKTGEQNVVATAKTAFIRVLLSDDRVTLAQQTVDALHEFAEQLAQRKPSSDLSRIDLNSARMQESRARRELAAAMQSRSAGLNALRRLLGLPPSQEIELAGAPVTEVKELPAGPALVERALQQRSDLIALRHSLQRADLQVAAVKRERIPNITLSGSVSRFEGDTLAGGDVGIPIPIFQRKTAETQEAIAERERADLQVKNLEQQIAREVLDARDACVVAGGDLQAEKQEILPASEENYQLERRLYERGAMTAAELINMQIDLLAVRRDYLDAVETYNTSLIDLEHLTGGEVRAE